jgi:hypothetical protein
MVFKMNWQNNPELVAAVTGSAVYAFYKPQKRLVLTIVNFVIGVAVAAVLSPAANDLLHVKIDSLRGVVSFTIGFLGMAILPGILVQVEKRRDSIASKILELSPLKLKEDKNPPDDKETKQ